jgi:hypothetical protein
MRQGRVPTTIALCLMGACRDLPVECTSIPRPAIRATISDSVTGFGAAYSASLVLQSASVYDSTWFDETLGVHPSSDTWPPFEMSSNVPGVAGTYTVRVRRPGYRLWQASGVAVNREACGAIAAHLTVRLQPEP